MVDLIKNKYKNIPKALVKFNKKPNLIKIIDDLFNQNFKEIILITASKNEQIGTHGRRDGCFWLVKERNKKKN